MYFLKRAPRRNETHEPTCKNTMPNALNLTFSNCRSTKIVELPIEPTKSSGRGPKAPGKRWCGWGQRPQWFSKRKKVHEKPASTK